ncbi:MAG: hypothetical protein KGJ89_02540 [Patescibacteria group bacterium]|nr:hypothetical protein [Patescibacteria group bacterium]MDE2015756.1 hypothetical protein [Patescibacteria group bacterium]MDE2226813.1 hypothetical protein [Patescibacteria group bacterium]
MKSEGEPVQEVNKAESFSEGEMDTLRRVFNNLSGLERVYGEEFSPEDLSLIKEYVNGEISKANKEAFNRFKPSAKNMLRALKSVTEEQFFALPRGTGSELENKVPTPAKRRRPPDLDSYDGK